MRRLSLFPTLLIVHRPLPPFPLSPTFKPVWTRIRKATTWAPPRNGARWRRRATPPLNSISGLLYLDGHGVPQSPVEAANWFRRAAEQDYPQAQHNLGAMYGSGQGVKRDYVQAYKWLNICAAKGNADA